jgi:transcriptional regulator with XRE-family HTH domain
MTFGQRLARERQVRGFSQDTLAAAAGLHRDAICKIERGKRSPKLDTLVVIARVLGVSVGQVASWHPYTRSHGQAGHRS